MYIYIYTYPEMLNKSAYIKKYACYAYVYVYTDTYSLMFIQ